MAQTPNQPTSVDAFRNFEDEANQRATWGAMEASNSASPGLGGMKDSLAALYRPPFDLMFQGTFEQVSLTAIAHVPPLLLQSSEAKQDRSSILIVECLYCSHFQGICIQAKSEAARQGKWLLVNLQSTKEFSSYTVRSLVFRLD